MSAQLQHSIRDLADMLVARIEEVCLYLLPNGVKNQNWWQVGSIAGEPGQSLKVPLSGDLAGRWKDWAIGTEGDLVELWTQTRGISKVEALREIRRFLGVPAGVPLRPVPTPKVGKEKTTSSLPATAKPVNAESLRQRKSALRKHTAAVQYLTGESRGLTQETIDYFALGLSEPYERDNGVITAAALVAPMRSPTSGEWIKRFAYITIPDVTQNPMDANGWMKGSPTTYYSAPIEAQRVLFVCEGLKDVWRHWQALKEAKLDEQILLISSTHGSAIPAEWKSLEFWAKWDAVYLGQDSDEAGDRMAERVLELMGREGRRIKVPSDFGKDWTDFWQHGGSIEEFKELLDDAPVASGARIQPAEASGDRNIPRIGRFSHKPVDINGAYVNGFLYYPTQTHVIKRDEETGGMVERLETVVVRSDRTTHRAVYAPAPAGTPLHQRVLKLTDGTVIEKEPKATSVRTWDYEAIQNYLDRRFAPRPLKAIVADVISVLRQSIWLPYDEDYVVLALTVPVTYLQYVFESVPLLLLNGAPGTGKSQTGNTMAKLCANGQVVGQVSAATAARMIDETRGFVVLDDVESIAAKAGKDIQTSELVQALKVSYNKHTAVKFWTDIKTNKIERLDFYGVKLLSNTLGADAILGSRMIRIQTRKMPDGMKSDVRDFTVEDLRRLYALRNELHTWAFENVQAVDRIYREVYANKTDRQAEIAAPLRTMARIVSDPAITAQLEAALSRQHVSQTLGSDDPVETLKEAVRNLIKQGYETVTLTHLQLEMRALLDANYGMASKTDIPEWDRPEWLGRQLRSHDLVANAELGRKRVFGKNLRLVRFSEWVVSDVVETHDEAGNPVYAKPNKTPEAFCQGCQACPYRTAGCELMELRQREESRQPRRTH